EARARDAVEAVAAGDELAVEALAFALPHIAHMRPLAGEVHWLHVLRFGDERGAAAIGGGEQILLQVRLPVGDEALAEMAPDVDHKAFAPRPDDPHAVVLVPFALEPLREAVVAQHIDARGLEHAGADAREHVLAGVLLEHHARHALAMQQLAKEQAGGPAADDRDLRLQRSRAMPAMKRRRISAGSRSVTPAGFEASMRAPMN